MSDLDWAKNLSEDDRRVVSDLVSEITAEMWKDLVKAQRLTNALELIKKLALQTSDQQLPNQ